MVRGTLIASSGELLGTKRMARRVLIAGGGIGGLAAALACKRRGCEVTVLEAAREFGEVGAGIQLGPNAMKVLAALGVESDVLGAASLPQAIVIADVRSGRSISRMLLGEAARIRYGQTYATVHRADLHGILLAAVKKAGAELVVHQALQKYEHTTQYLYRLNADFSYKGDVLIGADGVHSAVRKQLIEDGAPSATGHAAFRALIPSTGLPLALRTPHVRVWWGRNVHVVSYPIRGGSLWNLVVLAKMADSHADGWSLPAQHIDVMQLFDRAEPELLAFLAAGGAQAQGWKRWNLFDREPLAARDMAKGGVALLGDAAHPMLPYLAQGAAMALEDAWALGESLSKHPNAAQALQAYATERAGRNARVVQTARRNGKIFHLHGPLALARDAVLSIKGTAVVGMPWLYGFNPCASKPSAASG